MSTDRAGFLKRAAAVTGLIALGRLPEIAEASPEVLLQVVPVTAFPPITARMLSAPGGICAPLTPYYTLTQLSSISLPVRDALPAFAADRGGINY